MMPGDVETAVIGGGPAGAAAAIRLAGAGHDVIVLERDSIVRHKVCGEFLSGEALSAFPALGLSAVELGAATLDRVRLVAGPTEAQGCLPFPAAGLSRAVLDEALLRRAETAGARVVRGVAVRRIERQGRGLALVCGNGERVRARRVVLATGKHDLAPFRRTTRWRGRDGMIGLKMHLRLNGAARARLGTAIELFLFPGGCAGLQPVGEMANLCITLNRNAYARASRRFDRLLADIATGNPAFAEALRGTDPVWEKPAAIARVPYGFVGAGAGARDVSRVGDQIAVTASFTGDGLAIALQSGIAAADAILAGESPMTFERDFGSRARRQLRPAMLLQGLVDRPALHRPAVASVRRVPGLIGFLARQTRLPAGSGQPLAPCTAGSGRPGTGCQSGSLAPDRVRGAVEKNEVSSCP